MTLRSRQDTAGQDLSFSPMRYWAQTSLDNLDFVPKNCEMKKGRKGEEKKEGKEKKKKKEKGKKRKRNKGTVLSC